jgi:hypothetical protein
MNRKLTIKQLAIHIRKEAEHHRKAIEKALNGRTVAKRSCGCLVHWEWIWSGVDWIFPDEVHVEVEACDDHEAYKVEIRIRDRLTENLYNLKYQSLGDSFGYEGDDE